MTRVPAVERLLTALQHYEGGIVTEEEIVGLVVFLAGFNDVAELMNLLYPGLHLAVRRRIQPWPGDDDEGNQLEFPVLGTNSAERAEHRGENRVAVQALREYFGGSV